MNQIRPVTNFAAIALATGLVITGCSDTNSGNSKAVNKPDRTVETSEAEAAAPEVAGGSEAGRQDVRLVSVNEADALAVDPNVTVIDVRTPEEFAEGHLERASLLNFHDADFQKRLAELDRSGDYLIYCRSGNRSGQTAVMMKDLGFKKVSDVAGGIIAWGEAGKSLTK